MKISELIKLHGLPVKITRGDFSEGNWFEVVADRRLASYPGFHSNGAVGCMGDSFDDWERYVELKPKKKLEAYIVFREGCNGTLEFGQIPGIKSTSFNGARAPKIYRVPEFDCEVEV